MSTITLSPSAEYRQRVVIQYRPDEAPQIETFTGWGRNRHAVQYRIHQISIHYRWESRRVDRRDPDSPRVWEWMGTPGLLGRQIRKDGSLGVDRRVDLAGEDGYPHEFVKALMEQHRPVWTPPDLGLTETTYRDETAS